MLSKELVGRRVRVVAWYDHAQLIADHRGDRFDDGPEGTVTHLNDITAEMTVRIDEYDRAYALKLGDVEILP